jgi:hypothetical protein
MARKALCSIGVGLHAEYLALTCPTFADYAERHGYDLHLRDALVAPERPAAWSKLALLRELQADYDALLWLDADAIVVAPDRDILDDLPAGRFLGLVEHRYDNERVPNTGVMIFRTGPTARAFLDAAWSRTRFLHHPWWDQAAVADVLGYRCPAWLTGGRIWRAVFARLKFRYGIDPLPARPVRPSAFRDATQFLPGEWNVMTKNPAPDARIRHFPGLGHDQRLEALRLELAH